MFSQNTFGLDKQISDSSTESNSTFKDTQENITEQNDKSSDVEIEKNFKEDNNIKKTDDVVTNFDPAVTKSDDTVTDVKSDNVQDDDKKIDSKPVTEHYYVTTDIDDNVNENDDNTPMTGTRPVTTDDTKSKDDNIEQKSVIEQNFVITNDNVKSKDAIDPVVTGFKPVTTKDGDAHMTGTRPVATDAKEFLTNNFQNINNLRINEILANPDGKDSGNEFVELFNDGDDDIELDNLLLCDKSAYEKFIEQKNNNCFSLENFDIAPKDFLTLYNKTDFKFALNNSNEKIILIDTTGNTFFEYSYKTSTSGRSWNYDKNNWYEENPTPSEQNLPNPLTKKYPQIYINELLPNPKSGEDEFIELYNPTNEIVPLKNWILKDASKTGKFTFKQQVVQPKSFLVIYKEDFKFALNNSGGETVSLIAPNNKTISSVFYTDTKRGLSLNRAKSWYFAESSPGKKNNENPKTKVYPQLLLSEVLPNPIGYENTDEFVEVYNPNNFDVDLKYWTIKDASKTGEYTFNTNLFIKANSYFTIYRSDFKFALNNGDESVSLIAPNDKITSTVTYTGAKEGVSYNYNQIDKNWRWSKHLTPNKPNIFNNLPIITKFDIDKKVYKDVYAEFSAKAKDADGEKLKVRWDFGDGHKSYLWKTRHKYQKTGIYQASLRTQDGSEEVIKNFEVIVKKYPKYDITITKILPNPTGKDTGNEYIVLKNESKKNINLKDWSVATGTSKKTLVNHPITKKLIIKKGKTKIINKKYASITLPNKTGTIELRRPNKSVSDKLTYGDKNVSIPENAIYEKINKKWKWIVPIDPSKQAQTQEIIAQALKNEQILSQQKLESLIAYEAIHNPPKEHETEILNNKSLLESIAKYINSLLNKTIIVYNDFKKNISTKKEVAINAPIYKIPDNKNPCAQPTLYNFDNLHICE